MKNDINNIILERLNIIRNEIADLKSYVGDRFDRHEQRLSALEHHMQGLMASINGVVPTVDQHEKRLSWLEKAADFPDSPEDKN